jgi:hypothetical protein
MHVNARFRDENDGVRFRFAVVGLCQKKPSRIKTEFLSWCPGAALNFFEFSGS